jgi:hypothetical protein
MHIVFWRERQKERDHSENLVVGGKITIRWMQRKYDEAGFGFIWLRIWSSHALL